MFFCYFTDFKRITRRSKGQAGSAVFLKIVLLPKYSVRNEDEIEAKLENLGEESQ